MDRGGCDVTHNVEIAPILFYYKYANLGVRSVMKGWRGAVGGTAGRGALWWDGQDNIIMTALPVRTICTHLSWRVDG